MADNGSQQRKPSFKAAVEDVKAIATVLATEAEDILGRRTARFLGILALFVVVVGSLLGFLDWYIAPTDAQEKQSLVLTLAQILGGTALLSGLYFTWRSLQVNRDQQVTERFTRAIDQLGATDDKGNKKLEIRLGGIYALERIAWDSPQRDYSTVMEVLTAYVRENPPQAPRPSEGSSEDPSTSKVAASEVHKGEKQPAPPEPRRPTADIQAILDVLSRTQDRVPEEYRTRLDLHEAHLRGANLEGAHLEEANLRRANLEEAILREAHLQGARLRGADLVEAILQGANLEDARLRGANLEDARLQGAILRRAILQGAILRGAKVTNEQLADTLSLQGATMPDGQKHEDWRLKDKEGSGKDAKN